MDKTIASLYLCLTFLFMLNANGLVYMAFGIPQIASVFIYPILISILVLLVTRKKKMIMHPTSIVFVFGLITYVVISIFSSVFVSHSANVTTLNLLLSYLSSVIVFFLFVIGLSSYFPFQLLAYLRILAIILVFACILVPLSLIYRQYLMFPPLEITRGFGLFANPNEAGVVSCFTIALLLFLYRQTKEIRFIVSIIVPIIGVLASFSKTAIFIMGIIFIAYSVLGKSKYSFILIVISSITVTSFLINMNVDGLVNIGFTSLQAQRLNQVAEIIFTGQINATTTTSRTLLWEFGFNEFVSSPYIGQGMGMLHKMDYITDALGNPQGVHNMYLMLLGESGTVPIFIILTSLIYGFSSSAVKFFDTQEPKFLFAAMIFLIVIIDGMASHHLLSIKYNIIFLAIAYVLRFSSQGFSCFNNKRISFERF